jgi:hypothetical protein
LLEKLISLLENKRFLVLFFLTAERKDENDCVTERKETDRER